MDADSSTVTGREIYEFISGTGRYVRPKINLIRSKNDGRKVREWASELGLEERVEEAARGG